MTNKIKIISPVDGSVVAERNITSNDEINQCLTNAQAEKSNWQMRSVLERADICHQAIDYLRDNGQDLAREISQQMGRPIKYSLGEIAGLEERARYMIDIAEQSLADIKINKVSGFTRYITREPLGIVLTIAPWNYPYLTAINSIIPALMAGNCVILKHSAQTLLCAERLYEAFEKALTQAGIGKGVFQYLHLNHQQTSELVRNEKIDFVSFTGSVSGGEKIEKSVSGLFKGLALELGGKDPAYVRSDVDIEYAVEHLVDGAFFNSGQSCCGIERIYVDENIYESFVEKFNILVNKYVLGDSLNYKTTLGPMVNNKAADFVRQQISQACQMGATACIDETLFEISKPGTAYLAPQVLINVNHNMSVMLKESFGPVVGIMSVSTDEEALKLMNDSPYGLTASIWTSDEEKVKELGRRINTGTVYMNRCDYLDPALAWVGVKNSGRGCSLSSLGYEQLTRPKSYNLKTEI